MDFLTFNSLKKELPIPLQNQGPEEPSLKNAGLSIDKSLFLICYWVPNVSVGVAQA